MLVKCRILLLLFLSLTKIVCTQEDQISIPIKHSDNVTRLVYDPLKHYYVFTGSKDGSIIVWTYNGIFIKRFDIHASSITDIAIDLNNKYLYSSDDNGYIYKIYIDNSLVIKSYQQNSFVTCLSYLKNRNNEYLLAGSKNGDLIIFDTSLNVIKKIGYINKYPIKIVPSARPNQCFVAFRKKDFQNDSINENKSNIEIIDLNNFNNYPLSPYFDNLSDLYISKDSTRLLSASADNNTIRVFDGIRLIELNSFKIAFKPSVVFMSANNKLIGIASAESGEAQLRRHTGESLMDYSLKTDKIIFGEFNDDITRIHLCSVDGVFNVYDFNGNYRENRGVYASFAEKISCIHITDSIIYSGTFNGKISFFNYKNKTYNFLSDSFNVKVNKISTANNLLLILLSPDIKVNEFTYDTYIKSRLLIYKNNKVLKELVYNDRYITDFFTIKDFLLLFFNNGEILIYNLNSFILTTKYNFKPIEISKVFYNNNKILLDFIDNEISIYELSVLDNKLILKEQKKIRLLNTEEILDFSDKYLYTTKRIIKIPEYYEIHYQNNFKSAFIDNDTIYALRNFYLYKLNIKNNTVDIVDSVSVNYGILGLYKKFVIIAGSTYYNILDKSNLKEKYILYLNKDLSWILTDKQYYEISENLINSVKTVKGLSITNNKKVINEKIKKDLFEKIIY